jgi:phosphohistidine phosphatase
MDVMTAQRQLIVMRHAKAGELPGGPDVERALRPRGRRNASAAGRWLAERGFVPDLVLCSHARRARQTWQYMSAELSGDIAVINDRRLYDACAADLIEIFAETQPQVRSLMYVGHNPAAADLAETLVGGPVALPTAAIAVIELDSAWPGLAGQAGRAESAGQLVASWTPQPES